MTDQRITDRDLHAAFVARASGAPSAELAERIHAAMATTRQNRPLIVLPGFGGAATARLAWAAVLAATTLALVGVLAFGPGRGLFTSDVPTPTPSSSPSPTAPPSGSPSPSPSTSAPTPSGPTFPTPGGLAIDSLGRVVATDGLRVRSLPTVGAESIRHEPPLLEGIQFLIVAGPVQADGYDWYQIDPYTGDAALPFGWVAAADRDGTPWIESITFDCPSQPSVADLQDMGFTVAIACYGDATDLTLTGTLSCSYGDIEGPVTEGPEWLETSKFCNFETATGFLSVVGKPVTGLLDAANPGGEGNPISGQYTVVAHYGDPGAQTCRTDGGIEGDVLDPAQVILNCRGALVVTEVTPLP